MRDGYYLFWLLMGCLGCASSVWADQLRLAVAANFAAPIKPLVALFEQQSGHQVRVSIGSSGKFYAQIRQGAQFDVLLSADELIPERLINEGLALADSRFVYATGRLVLWGIQARQSSWDERILLQGGFRRLAIGDPKVVPYGLAAQQLLQQLGVWSGLQAKLVTGESIAQAYQFVASGNAEFGLLARSQMKAGQAFWLVPETLHQPLRQAAVQLKTAQSPAASTAWLQFLQSPQARQIMQQFGYQ